MVYAEIALTYSPNEIVFFFSSILLSIAMNFLHYLIIHCCQFSTTISALCTSPKHAVITTLPIENILVTFINQCVVVVTNSIVNQVMICMPLYYFYIHVPHQVLLPMALNATDTPDTCTWMFAWCAPRLCSGEVVCQMTNITLRYTQQRRYDNE